MALLSSNKNAAMKKTLLVLSLISFVFIGCETEGCQEINSWNYDPEATVDDGSCDLWRNQFLGFYEIEENCGPQKYQYNFSIYEGNFSTSSIVITNFGDFGINLNADVKENFVSIPNQTFINNGNEITVNGGLGEIRNGVLTLNYQFIFNGSANNCIMQCFSI